MLMCVLVQNGWSVVHYAAYYRTEDCVKLLLAKGCTVHSSDYRGGTALHVAAMKNEVGIAGLLIHSGADIEARDNVLSVVCIADE